MLLSATLALGAAAPGRATLPEKAPSIADYAISVRLDAEKKELAGRERLTWRNPSGDNVPDLWFHLYLNAFRNNRSTFFRESNGRSRDDTAPADGWGWIDVVELKLADGTDLLPALTFEHPDDDNAEDRTVARVLLPRPVGPGEEIALDITFAARLPEVYARTGYKGDFYAVAQWFPKLAVYEPAGLRGRTSGGWNCHQFHANSEFYADYGHYNVEMTVPSDLVVAAPGRRVASQENPDGTTTYVHELSDVHDFAWAADPRFIDVVEVFDAAQEVSAEELASIAGVLGRSVDDVRLRDVEIRLHLQSAHRAQIARHLAAAKLSLKWFGLWYGAYPYPTLTIVDPPAEATGASGVEYPTLLFAGTTYANSVWPFSGLRELELVIVHEIAHQYWYGLVGSNEFEEAWLDEGFATYSTARAMTVGYGRDRSLASFLGLKVGAVEVDRLANHRDRRFDRIATPSWQFSRRQYAFNAYSRPALVLQTLEGMLGEPTMARVMRTYHERFRFGHPWGEDFFAVAEEVAGRDLGYFFDQVIRGTGVFDPAVTRIASEPVPAFRGRVADRGVEDPSFVTEQEASDSERAEPESDSLWHSELELRQLGEVMLPVEVELRFEDLDPERRVWDGARRWERWTFDRPERLLSAHIDPDGILALDADRLNNARRTREDRRTARSLSVRFLFWVEHGLAWLGM